MSRSQQACSLDINFETGNVAPLLNEVRHALRRLIDSGEPTTIDLRAIPLAPGEEDEIERRLGVGEVTIQVNALGPSEIRETSFPGVWLVIHYNGENEVLGKYVEIDRIPAIVVCPAEDLYDGLESLTRLTDNN